MNTRLVNKQLNFTSRFIYERIYDFRQETKLRNEDNGKCFN